MVGAGLPHLPSVLSASKSYSERLFRYARIDRLDREAADLALIAPAEREGVEFTPEALDALYEAADGYPYFVQAYGKVAWDLAPRSPITADDIKVSAPGGGGGAGGRLLRQPLRAGHPGRARLHARHGLHRRRARCRPPRWPRRSAASRRACPRPATA